MNTPNYEATNHQTPKTPIERFKHPLTDQFDPYEDDQFGTTSKTPLGQLLRLIGSLPEIRHEKVEHVRHQIDHGEYDINTNLDAAGTVASDTDGPVDWAVGQERTRQVQECLQRLPYEQREVIVLHLHEGLCFRDIAQSQDVSINTVQSRYRYGMEKLHVFLDEWVIS